MSIRDQIGKIIFGPTRLLPPEAPTEIRLRRPVIETIVTPCWCATCSEEIASTETAIRHHRSGHHVLSTAQGYIAFLRRVLAQNADYHRRILDLEHWHSKGLEEIRELKSEEE